MSDAAAIRLDDLEPLPCPLDLGQAPDPRLGAVAAAGQAAMQRRLDVLAGRPLRGDDLRQALLGWFADLAAALRAEGCDGVVAARLWSSDPLRRAAMSGWLEGRWSSRPALIEACWRLEVEPTVITAAVLLFDRGGGTEHRGAYPG